MSLKGIGLAMPMYHHQEQSMLLANKIIEINIKVNKLENTVHEMVEKFDHIVSKIKIYHLVSNIKI